MEASTFSLFGLFTQSDLMTRFVSIMLVIASIYAWAIIIEKVFTLKKIKTLSFAFEKKFWSGGSLEELFNALKSKAVDPMAIVFIAAMKEWKKSSSLLRSKNNVSKTANLHQRIERVMNITMEKEMSKLEQRIDFLSMIGSIAPLVGLFGTIWGIMSSFSAIGTSSSTTLGVIAPGIATALSTTALGLIVAIPAVIGYNKITTDLSNYAIKLEAFTGEFTAIISRQIDENING
ncbi:MAG: protein TolQ [Alphaproteobacteria bacterium]|nr:protein TolQ [Alphaproteobacteria bacterium]